MVWEISIEKQLGTEYWINVYHADVATQAEAKQVGDEIVGVERGVSQLQIGFTKMRVRQVSEIAGPGTVYPIGLTGTAENQSYLPLFNVVRVDFAVPVGRPSRKYLKLPTPAASVVNGSFGPTTVAYFNSNYVTPLLAIPGICASDGQELLSGAAQSAVGMRQLRRGTRKKSTPIIP